MIDDLISDSQNLCRDYDRLEVVVTSTVVGFLKEGPFYPRPMLANRRDVFRLLYGSDVDKVWRHREAQQTLDNHKRLQEWLDK